MKKIILTLTMAAVTGLMAWADGTNSVPQPPKTPPPIPDRLTVCPVTGNKLGDMGKPIVFIYKNQEVKLCCPACKAEFDKNPAKYMAKIRKADPPPAL